MPFPRKDLKGRGFGAWSQALFEDLDLGVASSVASQDHPTSGHASVLDVSVSDPREPVTGRLLGARVEDSLLALL